MYTEQTMGCKIYGTEKVRYTWNSVDENGALIADTLDWSIEDTALNGDDATKTINDSGLDELQTKMYDSSGEKKVKTEVEFDDGWGTVFRHATELAVEALVYEEPELGFSWTPEEPTVLEETTFVQENNDLRDKDVPSVLGRIDSVDVDYYINDELDVEDIGSTDEFKHTFRPKEDDGIDIKMIAEYWDGWETQTCELVKHLTQTNIPPYTDYTREDNGLCVPNYVWDASVTTDEDDATDELTYLWVLYESDGDDGWDEIETGDEITFTYPFQYENDYKLVLRVTDDDDGYTEKVDEFKIQFDACDSSGSAGAHGTIVLQPNRFQDIAIPVTGKKVKEYFLGKVAKAAGVDDVSEVIELVKAYPSSDASDNKYLIFIPGKTKETNSGNFDLVQTDGDYREITAFRCLTKEFEGTIEIDWTSADGEE